MAVFLQRIESEHNVFCSERCAITKACLGPQKKRHRHLVVSEFSRLGHKAVNGVGLVVAADHQRVEQKADPFGGVAAQDEAIEMVEGVDRACRHGRQAATLGGIRVHIVEMLELSRIFKLTECRQTVTALCGVGLSHTHRARQGKQEPE